MALQRGVLGRRSGEPSALRTHEDALALRTTFRFEARASRALVEVVALRRPDLVLRRTRYARIVVDERILTRAFAWISPPSRLQAIALVEGRIAIEAGDETIESSAGDVLLLTPPMASRARFERTLYLDLEWDSADAAALPAPRVVGRASPDALLALGETLADPARPHRAVFADAFALLRKAGVPLEALSADALTGGPSDRDERVARAIEAQLSNLATKASSLHFGEIAELSPRQLQRIVEELAARYGLNAGNWRDMRNRWRIQIAAVLLSVPELTLSAIADEVGYASAAALTRAFANAGLPPPSELREAFKASAR